MSCNQVERCEKAAEDCLKRSEAAVDPEEKKLWLDLVLEFLRLAAAARDDLERER
jgi:hypothetical protein